MKTTYNKKTGNVNINMSYTEYLRLRRIVANVAGVGAGYKYEKPTSSKTITEITCLYFDEERMLFSEGDWPSFSEKKKRN